MPPAIIAAGVGAAGSIAGSVIGGNAASDAAQTQAQAAQQAAQLQFQEFNQVQQEETPYIQSGNAALQALMQGLGFTQAGTGGAAGGGTGAAGGAPSAQAQIDWIRNNITASAGYNGHVGHQIEAYLAGNPGGTPEEQLAALNQIMAQSPSASATTAFQNWVQGQGRAVTGTGGWQYSGQPGSLDKPFTPQDLQNTPGYQFTLNQGLEAIENSASARGGVGGGNTLKAITGYAEGLADTTYQQQLQDYMANQQQQLGALQTVAGSGQNAVANLGALGSSAATNAGNALIGAGNAQSAGIIGGANALTSGIAGLTQNFLSANSPLFGGGGGYGPGAFSNLGSPDAISNVLTYG